MLDNQNVIDSIYECEVVVIILNESLQYDTYEHSIYFLSQIEMVNFTFEPRCAVITENIDYLREWSSEVYSRHGGELGYSWNQHKPSQYSIKK